MSVTPEPRDCYFDWERFALRMEETRIAYRQSWRDVARETGLAPSTLTRLQQGKTITVDAMVKLCDWSNLAPGLFMEYHRVFEWKASA